MLEGPHCKKCRISENQAYLYPCRGCKQPICHRCKVSSISNPVVCYPCSLNYSMHKDSDVTFLKRFYFSTILKQYLIKDVINIILDY